MIEIRQLNPREPFPWKLLYTADPSPGSGGGLYRLGRLLRRLGIGKIIGVSVLLRTRPFTMELVNPPGGGPPPAAGGGSPRSGMP